MQTTLVFSHANSFPARTYRVLFEQLQARGFKVHAIDKFGHDARYPVDNNWTHLTQQLIDFTQPVVQRAKGPVFLVGHSLGGYLSLMAAARAPQLACGVVLLDSPVLGGWKATTLSVLKRTQIAPDNSPGRVSAKRRNSWASADEALAHFQHKKTFAKWDAQVLSDYITYGTHDETVGTQTRRVLSFDRAVETAIYNNLPHNLEQLLKQHPLKCPATYIGGTHSVEMGRVGMALTTRLTKGRVIMVDGGHLFPMENPRLASSAIETALLNLS